MHFLYPCIGYDNRQLFAFSCSQMWGFLLFDKYFSMVKYLLSKARFSFILKRGSQSFLCLFQHLYVKTMHHLQAIHSLLHI